MFLSFSVHSDCIFLQLCSYKCSIYELHFGITYKYKLFKCTTDKYVRWRCVHV